MTADGATYQPLWPFASQDEADRWLRDGAGDEQWHADPQATALRFTRDFLGFFEIDRTTSFTEEADEAWVGVGYPLPNGENTTAATLHLVRFGAAEDAPWEVVGSVDDTLTLSTPPYGHLAGIAIDAGGTVTGVDESLHLQAKQSTQPDALGTYCCLAAGGSASEWSTTLELSDRPQPGAVTLVVWTGGHVAEVEDFAITGLRAD
ncbi:hypothetical protein MAGR_50150 [Mycolicibacterium agri]|uniref:Uncharacterized protein n=1 Tax=Mycolicibacterium agri TaxID=36811 RepID=A0A7I9W7A2_MYCAG|nr:hypothetical protein MAGR_50150 [Mycolicibacterium agri]